MTHDPRFEEFKELLLTYAKAVERMERSYTTGNAKDWNGATHAEVMARLALYDAFTAALSAPVESATPRCPICKQPESHHLTVWAKGNPGRECPVDPRSPASPPSPSPSEAHAMTADERAAYREVKGRIFTYREGEGYQPRPGPGGPIKPPPRKP